MRAGTLIKYIKAIYPCHTKVFYQALQLISCLNNFCFYLAHYYMVFAWHCEISRYNKLCSLHKILAFYFIFHSAKMLTLLFTKKKWWVDNLGLFSICRQIRFFFFHHMPLLSMTGFENHSTVIIFWAQKPLFIYLFFERAYYYLRLCSNSPDASKQEWHYHSHI